MAIFFNQNFKTSTAGSDTLISPFCFCSLHVDCIIFKTPILNKNRTARGQLSYRNLRQTARKLRKKRLKTFQYFHSYTTSGCLKHSPTLVPFHYTRPWRVHAEKFPCCWFSSLLHEHFDPHTRVPRKGDRIESNVSCLDWVIQCMFWKFRNGAKRNWRQRIVLSGSNYFNEHQR